MRLSLKGIVPSDRWFNLIVVGSVSFGFLLVIAAGIAATQAILEDKKRSEWVAHTFVVEREVSRFRVLAEQLETARRGYILRTDRGLRSTLDSTIAQIIPTLDTVERLTADNGIQQRNAERAKRLVQQHVRQARQTVALVDSGRRAEAVASFNDADDLAVIREIRDVVRSMMAREDELLNIRQVAQQESLRRFFYILGGTGVLLVLVGIFSIGAILRYTRDLTASRDALRQLNANLEGLVSERTTDLQRANEEIQRFAYIVSHDLRSPLVNVMGFTAELEASTKLLARLVDKIEREAPEALDQEAREAARSDLPEAIGFIRTSTQKMDRLINAILRLSREGRRPITPERIDMSGLLQGVADSLRHRVDEIGAEIVIGARLPEIVSDRLAIEQIFSNLIENATKYLQPGRPGRIEVRGALEGGRAVFDVADNGRGIDPRDHERIFDLFRRSGVQDQPGEGIGLAHTRALAYRLGGTIHVESKLGEGATFRVSLPTVFSGEQGIAA